MAKPARPIRHGSRPGLLGVALLLATLGLAGVLGLEAARAARSHRGIVEGTLRHYASIAAWQYARQGRIWLSWGMNEAAAAIGTALPAPGRPLPGPDLLRRVLAEKECDCMSAGFARTTFRATLGSTPELLTDGDSLPATVGRQLIELFAEDSVARRGPRSWRILAPGAPDLTHPDDVVLAWAIADRGVPLIYGMVVEAAQIRRPLEGALGDAEFFPPAMTGGIRADSLMRIHVEGANGASLLGTGSPAAVYSGVDTLGSLYGGLTVTASIEPEVASVLVGGGVPSARLPQIGILLALTLAIGAAALILLRREQQLAQLRDDFVSGVSHELRTPLTQVRMLSELLQGDGFRTEPERARAIGIIHREALRLTNLVDNILQFARLRRQPASPEATAVPITALLEETRDVLEPLAQAGTTSIVLDPGEPLAIRGDRDSLARIVRNLLENAIKYGRAGQTVRIAAAAVDPGVRITIDDQGPGVPAEERLRIWQPYYRLERHRNAAIGGSGLGLSVVNELVEALGGRAWVEDAPGGGARFVVELPGTGESPT